MQFDNIKLDIQNSIAIITFNQAARYNCLTSTMIHGLSSYLKELEINDDIKIVILTGGPTVFSAGADLKEITKEYSDHTLHDDFIKPWECVSEFKKPIIAMVHGLCIGGGFELALMCDMIMASSTAQFGQPEITLGIMPGGGGTQRLTAILGKHRAMELCLKGHLITASEALAMGLMNHVYADENLEKETMRDAIIMASYSHDALQSIKQAIVFQDNINAGVQLERALFHGLLSQQENHNCIVNFLNKKKK
jgi:enoyl-CoA hydratase